jgi:hypothetical protein
VSLSLFFLLAVVLITAAFTGGIGFGALGSQTIGGRKYAGIIAAIVGYFGLTSRRIPARHAGLYLALFLLPNLTSLIDNLAYFGGPSFYFLLNVFAPDFTIEQAKEEATFSIGFVRYYGFATAAQGVWFYLLARHGIRGTFDPAKPWRALLLALAVAGALLSGFRSVLLMLVMTFAFVFWLEGAWRTRLLPIFASAALILGVIALPHVREMPLAVQRALSVVPLLQVDPVAQESADASTDWRIEMWKDTLPEIPKHLLRGQGYAMTPNELAKAEDSILMGKGAAGTAFVGDYHNGPLSVVMPFGIWGVAGLLWFWTVSLRYLYQHYRYGDPALKQINTFFLGWFLMRIVFFSFVFGGIALDLWAWGGILGLAVSVNGARVPEPAAAASSEEPVGEEMQESVY